MGKSGSDREQRRRQYTELSTCSVMQKAGKEGDKSGEKPKVAKYTWREVLTHQRLHDLWLVLDDKIYDLSTFDHPGGEIILEGVGVDAIGLFEDVGHSAEARAELEKLFIGVVEEEKEKE